MKFKCKLKYYRGIITSEIKKKIIYEKGKEKTLTFLFIYFRIFQSKSCWDWQGMAVNQIHYVERCKIMLSETKIHRSQ